MIIAGKLPKYPPDTYKTKAEIIYINREKNSVKIVLIVKIPN